MSLPGYDNWLCDQDRYYGEDLVTEDMFINWNEANDYIDEGVEENA